MSLQRRTWVVAAVASVCLAVAGSCLAAEESKAKTEPPNAPKAAASPAPAPAAPAPAAPSDGTARSVVGAWVSEPILTPLGKAVQTFCFAEDGSVRVLNETQAGPQGSMGTYKLDGNHLSVQWPNAPAPVLLKLSWSDDRLVLTDPSGVSRSYKRTDKGC